MGEINRAFTDFDFVVIIKLKGALQPFNKFNRKVRIMHTIVGYKKNTGTIKETGKEWTNYTLYCTKEGDENVTGKSVTSVTVRPAIMERFFPDPKTVIGAKVDFAMEARNFNGRQTVSVVSIIKY